MVTIYTTTHCPYCKMAKDYFTDRGVAYREVNVEADDEAAAEMIRKVMEILGDEVPISFLRYYPDYKMAIPPTPVETLMKHYRMAKELGVKYAYVGNVPGIHQQNTDCPNCGEMIIKRDFMKTIWVHLTADGKCPVCNTPIPVVVGKYHPVRQPAASHGEVS